MSVEELLEKNGGIEALLSSVRVAACVLGISLRGFKTSIKSQVNYRRINR